jgi:hypothetical protein
MFVNRVQQPAAAGKLTTLVKPHVRGVALISIALLSLLFTSPALAEPIGLQKLEVSATNEPTAEQKAHHEPGSPDVQAGSHPYALVTSFVLSKPEAIGQEGLTPAGGGLKDVSVELPPGFVGNPNATPKCNYTTFTERKCSNDTAVGEATTSINPVGGAEPGEVVSNPVYNLEPPGAVAAEFGYLAEGTTPIFLESSVRAGGDYGITVNVRNIPQILQVYASKVTIWGVPGAAVHDPLRGHCLNQAKSYWFTEEEREGHNEEGTFVECTKEPALGDDSLPVVPLLTNPTSCGVPRSATLSVDGWREPGNFLTGEHVATMHAALPELSGCGKLDFSPTLSVQPDGTAGSTPTGLNVGIHVSQESTTNPEGLGEADVKETTVALPPGVQVSPSASDGLEACSGAPGVTPGTPGNEIGFIGFKELDPSIEPGVQTPQYTAYLPGSVAAAQAGETEVLRPGVNFCPDASKIANVKIKTPLLEGPLTGSVYLAAPQNFKGLPQNPFESLIAMYLVAEEPNTGVLVKLPGKVSLNETTGQISTTFANTPQTPFSDLELEFFGTARAPLATPALCGTYNTEASFVPWSTPPGGSSSSSAAHPPASFQIDSGPNGGSCTYPGQALPFSPVLASGTTNNNAGSFSDLTTTLSREDGQQSIRSVTLHYPAGLSGLLTGVKLCGEAEANAGTCGPESEIGETIVSVGLGNDPFTVTGGKAYITGPYNGTSTCTVGTPGCAPFGLSIVNPAKAGPFDLQEGRPVVVRAKIEVDPHTAALTVTTNPSGSYAIPSMIEGIPLQIKHVNVSVNRASFAFNPTSCEPMKVQSTIASAEGASSTTSIPFQVANCASLAFKPSFSVSTSAKTSKANGASLDVKVVYPPNSQGTEANIAKVKVELPKSLPARLTTLQKACTEQQFAANPAGCPSASIVGHAIAHTPILNNPLEGPAYFVSHGGAAFPELILVLQGEGITIDLAGETFINKKGITSTTFEAVPDAPFSSFELTLPEGKYSALAANGNLCKQKLTMPTELKAQNGAEIKQNTEIEVTGCPNSISISSHKVKGKTTTIEVSVPAAGKVIASGKGVSKASKTASGRETVSLVLNQKKAGKLKTNIKLTFTPSKGAKQSKNLTVEFKR